ncbi:HepT-like ribonuclease domain-containing protein [Pseudofrankia inefficax]|uniref:HepT-like ribonuclease domain-containing protein n=1 Tax=Pseudofrankia inefficax (strain DSM 45817 / CECT 9037 / DDB 130130 / EuI1c) TaxID=298654 RepID=UPI0001BFB1D8|nr:HepT-like ribonuclease domain-containing protein [Pseudofrankia inefficax]
MTAAGQTRSGYEAVGFRNVLVHDYIQVDDDIVTGRLKDLGDLEDFVRSIARYLAGAEA